MGTPYNALVAATDPTTVDDLRLPSPASVIVVLIEGPWDALAVTHGGGDPIGLAACGTAVTDHDLNLPLGHITTGP